VFLLVVTAFILDTVQPNS